jgi:hypothetical protein
MVQSPLFGLKEWLKPPSFFVCSFFFFNESYIYVVDFD